MRTVLWPKERKADSINLQSNESMPRKLIKGENSMLKGYCDRCGKEIEERNDDGSIVFRPIYVHTGATLKEDKCARHNVCVECNEENEEIQKKHVMNRRQEVKDWYKRDSNLGGDDE